MVRPFCPEGDLIRQGSLATYGVCNTQTALRHVTPAEERRANRVTDSHCVLCAMCRQLLGGVGNALHSRITSEGKSLTD